jgi:LacI family repressor for deo operon, udp, cdd, tsx, nupC, and nupG
LAIVSVGEPVQRRGLSSIVCGTASVVEDAIGYLHVGGHRRIAMVVGAPRHPHTVRHLKSALAAAASAPSIVDLAVIHCESASASRHVAANEVLDRSPRPTAVFCVTDEIAAVVLQVARARGVRIPQDLSVLAVDEAGLGPHLDPPVSTLTLPFQAIGRACVGLVINAVARHQPAGVSLNLRYVLMERATTAPGAALSRTA